MPELPEVETTMRGLEPHITGETIVQTIIRCPKLRWPIDKNLSGILTGQTVLGLSRRGKYLLVKLTNGTLIIHLGMSGRLCVLMQPEEPKKHDHVDLIFSNKYIMRYTDPRRFGAIVYTTDDPLQHPLLASLGVEPLTDAFTAEYLLSRAKSRRMAIKPFIMDSKVVVGVGNIYATEALFLSGIHPTLPACELKQRDAVRLIEVIKKILAVAITQGGTTLKDFMQTDGRPGYFAQQLHVYGRGGLPCTNCGGILQSCFLGQRSTVFCQSCQV